MKEIYFLRHGQTDYNKQRIVQGGGVDSSLNADGVRESLAFFEKYQTINFDVVLTSTLKRTRETIHLFINKGVPHERFASLNEMSWGIHEGKQPNPEMHQEYKAMIAAWQEGRFDEKIEGGESASELGLRCREFLDHLANRTEKRILVCTHGRTIRALLCYITNEGLEHMQKYKHSNTALTKVLLQDDKYEVLCVNDICHLTKLNS